IVERLAIRTDRRKRALRVEALVAKELEQVSMKRVRAGFGHGIHRSGRAHAALRSEATRGHAEFLQRVWKGEWEAGGGLWIVVDGPVERIRHAELQSARYRDVHAALEVPAVGPAGLHRRAGEDDEIGDLAALERQLHDPLLFDDGADARAADVHERRC